MKMCEKRSNFCHRGQFHLLLMKNKILKKKKKSINSVTVITDCSHFKNDVYILHAIFLTDPIWRAVQYSEKLHATELLLSTNLPPIHRKQK